MMMMVIYVGAVVAADTLLHIAVQTHELIVLYMSNKLPAITLCGCWTDSIIC